MIVRAVCPHDCPDTCAMLVTVENGRAVAMAGDPDHPMTRGFLCVKVSRYVERTYHEGRLLYPQIRAGAKGEGKFRRATWDEALELIADKLQTIIESADGPEAILPYSYAGTMGLIQGEAMDRRFFHAIGASLLDRTICASAGSDAWLRTYGFRSGTDPEDVPNARLILLWGTNTLTSNPHLWPFVRAARDAGARVVCIDPLRTRTADASDQHVAIRPGTDAALALAMMHVIFRDGLENRAYLDAMVPRWERMRDRVLEAYSPASVAATCRIPASTIEALATAYATTRPAFIRLNYGLQRHGGGGAAVRAISLLPAVTGSWDERGGGAQLSVSQTFGINSKALGRPDLSPRGTRTINMSRLGEALTAVDDPPVRALVVYNSNPASVAPDRESVLRGLRRDDLFTVVLEHFQTDTADYADVLLPATTQLEHDDLHRAYGHLYVMYNRRAIEPLGETLPNSEIFRRLAERMGYDHPALRASDEEMMREVLASSPMLSELTLEQVREKSWVRLDVERPYLPFKTGTRLPTSSGGIEVEPLPEYVPPHESEERAPELASRFPLALISPPAHTFLNSTFVNVASLRRAASRPVLEIHADDAARRGISSGAKVSIFNNRGRFSAEAVVSTRVRPGVVSAPSVWWGKLSDDGANVNHTTSQAVTDMGGGATFYDNLVEVTAE